MQGRIRAALVLVGVTLAALAVCSVRTHGPKDVETECRELGACTGSEKEGGINGVQGPSGTEDAQRENAIKPDDGPSGESHGVTRGSGLLPWGTNYWAEGSAYHISADSRRTDFAAIISGREIRDFRNQ
jgi:hypothetical protein